VSYRVVRTPAAREDALRIFAYIAERSPNAAEGVIRRLSERIASLAGAPLRGTSREDIGAGYGQLVVRPYLIFYRVEQSEVVIQRIIDGRRDLVDL
jgi:toxin ParE1/3/4